MISLSLVIRNPWSHRFDNLWNRVFATSFQHKFIEVEFTRDSTWLVLQLGCTLAQSHAGVDLELGVLGYSAHVQFYDQRHWNPQLKEWQNP